mmetsp:Transcript_8332/g.20459  ORF Transcript_8332/g.20459 Transcript_8332/m.20459 type:complete len:328 (-) Transcript_8332:27-1010(-)
MTLLLGSASSVSLLLILVQVLTLYRSSSLTSSLSRLGREEFEFAPQHIDAAPHPVPNTRAQRLDRSKLPYKCGMVLFYHVPSTGGATINTWLTQYSADETAKYFTRWGRDPDGGVSKNIQPEFIEGGRNKIRSPGMNKFVSNIQPDEWRISHCHHGSLHLNITDNFLSQWRSEVESQGCAFVATVMFRDPLSHALSLYKHIERFNSTRDLWANHLYTKSEMGYWSTQLDYFLYNFITRNPGGVSKKNKVQRALQLLQDHFDIITVGRHDWLRDELLAMIGWENKTMARKNTYTKDITFTKKEVEEMQKLLDVNGDTEFVYEIKKRFR